MKPLYFFALFAFICGCSPARLVTPLAEGRSEATVALGGPLITYGSSVIPSPLTSLSAGYGVSDAWSVFGGLHTTALLFKDLQLDLGGLTEVLKQDGLQPGISIAPIANMVLSFRDGAFKFWPELDINAYWHYMSNGNFVYVGSSNWFELSSTKGTGEPQTTHWLPNLCLGHTLDGENWQYTIEAKYLGIGIENTPNVVDYHGIGGKGDLGIYLALTRKF